MPVTFKVDYFDRHGKISHSYNEIWERTDYYCPHCGHKEVWHDTSGGDFYLGEDYQCLACTANFHLPSGAYPREDNEQDKQRHKAIWAHIHSQ